jgi:carbon monoxide dehydrogenase subunit G
MEIANEFTVDAPIDVAWTTLTDIPFIAPCLPGAMLEGEEDGVYSGNVKIKVGPVTAQYKGTAKFIEKDDDAYKAVIDGKGRDSRGAGNANALITAQMHAEGERTRVEIVTDLKVSGKVAQFGRGVMQDVSEKLLGQFADCLEGKMAALDEPAADAAGDADSPQDAPPPVPGDSESSTTTAKEPEPIDLLDVAGGAATWQRMVPVAAGLAALFGIIRLLRRRSAS